MRSSFALIATAGLVAVALTGCAASAPVPEATPGDSSAAVVVTGKFGEEPKVSFPTPLAPEETQCTEIIVGTGPVLEEGQLAMVGLAAFNGATGDELQVSGFGKDDAVPLNVNASATMPGIAKGLTCAREGSRVVVVVPEKDGFGPNGNQSLGIEPGDSIVFVVDVQRAFPSRADGTPQLTRDRFPAVVLAPDGRPGITVPKIDPPKSLQQETLLQGDGEVVEDGDTVVVQYTGVLWELGDDGKATVFDSSWENGTPATFVVGTGGQVIPGFSTAVVGQKVGSQIGVIIPPSEGYGDQAQGAIPANSTLFFVIDILGVV
ncbi:peptidylprolyl isomerase [Agromyces sp. CF514]|uniref:FKBP-type peptidyl-prolyl cis-trans isomerase n=1 Tax=Agromyces sp. CF514 TaxID=1881031 RepID=UPI0008DFF16A|nr:FKBP-type peptidyl-prolyl cis-trans isomerase [Agromyces sp. CF514]SFR77686.1 peptidylprolyl isomerase [Agromyces sp. CF514]